MVDGATAERAVHLVRERKVPTLDGGELDLEIESICVHGDVINAPEVLSAMHKALKQAGVTARSAVQDLKGKGKGNGRSHAASAHA